MSTVVDIFIVFLPLIYIMVRILHLNKKDED